jgi:predicted dehydrogenase
MRNRRRASGRGAAPVRFAVVGQGYFAQSAILPAFANTRGCALTAIFSDTPTKLRALRQKYDVEYALPYDQFDAFLETGAVDAVYLAVPNDLHASFAEQAAGAGVHVLCEKPLAGTSAQAERIVAACARARVKLMVAYRLHYEEANLSAVEAVRSGKIGEPRYLSCLFSQQVTPDNTRTRRERAGGPLRDIGIYCINAARYLFRDEPTDAVALAATRPGDPRFREINEQVGAVLRFPGERLAQLTCSFGAYDRSIYTVVGTEGVLRLSSAFEVAAELVLEVEAKGKTKARRFKKRDQVAAELEEFASCVREDREPEPSGIEGVADLRVIEAIEESVRTGGRVQVDRVHKARRPTLAQQRRKAAHRLPDLVQVQAPSRH